MSKRPRNSRAPASASEDLIKRLKTAANDAVLVREIIESSDIGAVAAAVSVLLTGGSALSPNDSGLQKEAHNRPCRSLPAETFLEVVLFADRDTLDTMQLVCSFLLNFIRDRELTQLALRDIPQVKIGRSLEGFEGGDDCWLPVVETLHDRGAGKDLIPKSLHHLTSCLRLAYCQSVWINLVGAPEVGEPLSVLCDMVFHDLVAPNTFVGKLAISKLVCDLHVVARGTEAFKSVKTVGMFWEMDVPDPEPLSENFFASAAQHGVQRIEFKPESRIDIPANTSAALSFGFAEPTTGGDRWLLGVACDIGADFLEQIKQKVSELDVARHVDFNFKLANVSSKIDSAGFEKYQKDDRRTWLMNDLENHISVEVMQAANLIEIHVFSSV